MKSAAYPPAIINAAASTESHSRPFICVPSSFFRQEIREQPGRREKHNVERDSNRQPAPPEGRLGRQQQGGRFHGRNQQRRQHRQQQQRQQQLPHSRVR